MTTFRYCLIMIFLILGVCIHSISAKMYKWTDENGVTHFSDSPPPGDKQSVETYETSTSSSSSNQSQANENKAKNNTQEEPSNETEIINITSSDLLGKWKHLGVSKTLLSEKLSKPYKPQSWEFNNDGYVIYTIGDQTNRFPYKIEGNTIITTPFPNQNKSFVIVKNSYDKMVWKDPDWNSYIHVERVY